MNAERECVEESTAEVTGHPSRRRAETRLEQLARKAPIRATERMPEQVRDLLRPANSLYLRSERDPHIQLVTERADSRDLWRVSVRGNGKDLHEVATGAAQIASKLEYVGRDRVLETSEPHRLPWLDVEFVPRMLPYKNSIAHRIPGARDLRFLEPITYDLHSGHDEPLRYTYPWCTIGIVYSGIGTDYVNWTNAGSGVLVGRNLLLTASHVAPWGRAPGDWWMRFIPGYRAGTVDPMPHGNSYVERFYGSRYEMGDGFETSGKDYVICKLYDPLGDALGWMGSRSFGSEDDYFARRYISVGYPGYEGRANVEFDIDIDDIDGDGAGLELETTFGSGPMAPGWSGGPLWLWENEKPYVVGIYAGHEKDEFDPRRYVFGGGGLLVDRVKYGVANFA